MRQHLGWDASLLTQPRKRWLVTGAAGFIGSNLVEALLVRDQHVTGLDNFATGLQANLDEVRDAVGEQAWRNFTFIEGDTCDLEACTQACQGVDVILHQAALGSVPRSIQNPVASHNANVNGFLNILVAAKDVGISRVVYASSSSVYGDDPSLPKVEDRVGKPLSPYSLTKKINEQYAAIFAHSYGVKTIGLRYFNVFGKRQNPRGPYAAVIPIWISSLLTGRDCLIFGDGETSRDFCHVSNVIQANLLAGVCSRTEALNQVYNVSCGGRTTLKDLFALIQEQVSSRIPDLPKANLRFEAFRPGDVRHSQADISKIESLLGFAPTHKVAQGMAESIDWYIQLAQGMA